MDDRRAVARVEIERHRNLRNGDVELERAARIETRGFPFT